MKARHESTVWHNGFLYQIFIISFVTNFSNNPETKKTVDTKFDTNLIFQLLQTFLTIQKPKKRLIPNLIQTFRNKNIWYQNHWYQKLIQFLNIAKIRAGKRFLIQKKGFWYKKKGFWYKIFIISIVRNFSNNPETKKTVDTNFDTNFQKQKNGWYKLWYKLSETKKNSWYKLWYKLSETKIFGIKNHYITLCMKVRHGNETWT